MQFENNERPRIIRPAEARERLGVSRSQLAKMQASGIFPRPFAIVPGGRAVGWLEADVVAWIETRAETGAGSDGK